MEISLDAVRSGLDSAISLLERSYLADGEVGGWYHQLSGPRPGPTATACTLLLLHQSGRRSAHEDQALGLLKSRQVPGDDPVRSGGWATNTSHGTPVLECTAWVARMLGEAGYLLDPRAPDATAALRWLVANQNDDGGWGSLRGATSKVWLTCLALRGINRLDPRSPAIAKGLDWLLAAQVDGHGFPQNPGRPATINHTAVALITIGEVAPRLEPDRVRRAYTWLVGNLDLTRIDDPDARIEYYNVHDKVTGVQWQATMPHYGLPMAALALLRHPDGPHPMAAAAIDALLRLQLDKGHWRNVEGSAEISIWSLVPAIEALQAVQRLRIPDVTGANVALGPGVVVRPRGVTYAQLSRSRRGDVVREVVRKWWASALLILAVLVGVPLSLLQWIEWKDFGLSLILPLVTFVAQQTWLRTR
ncbi:prenyltransferase/squalene oxidase repeat-containing protein [Lentzea sp. NPDC051838]|uniref:prenyltransferase/squalene oxidase repeat-containing protein n=1 Tax=Lentzea sp. NPDC051838 TaxID=3154849 RepID=UPI00341F55E6